MNNLTKDYLFALLIMGNEGEKDIALRELCKRYPEISYYQIKRLVKDRTK